VRRKLLPEEIVESKEILVRKYIVTVSTSMLDMRLVVIARDETDAFKKGLKMAKLKQDGVKEVVSVKLLSS